MLLGARQFFERRGAPTPPLPYDSEVEYLESTGTQWIDTGVIPNSETSLEIIFEPTSFPYRFAPIAYCGDAYNAPNTFGFATSRDILGIISYYGTAVNISLAARMVAVGMNVSVAYRRGNSKIVVVSNGRVQERDYGGATYSQGDRHLYLLNGNTNTADLSHPAHMKVFSAVVSIGSENARELIPVRFTNELGESEGAMYDRVSGALFRNAGTGAFVIGPDKS